MNRDDLKARLLEHASYLEAMDPSTHTEIALQSIAAMTEAASAITDLEALVGELGEALEQAVEWDSHDAEGVPAVWLGNASATLTKLEKARGKDQTDG